MRLCVRGAGYIPDDREHKLITRARREDIARYRAIHDSVKSEADDEMRLR